MQHYKLDLIFLIIMIIIMIIIVIIKLIFIIKKFRYFSLPWLEEERSSVPRRPRHTSLQSPHPVVYTWDRCTLETVYFGYLSTLNSFVACVLWMPQYTLFCSLCTLDASVHFILQLVYFGCLSTLYSVACVLWMSQYTLFCSLCTLDASVHFTLQLVYCEVNTSDGNRKIESNPSYNTEFTIYHNILSQCTILSLWWELNKFSAGAEPFLWWELNQFSAGSLTTNQFSAKSKTSSLVKSCSALFLS